MRPNDCTAFAFKEFYESGFHFGLFRPAFLVRGKTEVTAGNQVNRLFL
jgi:hypothetical protein